MRGFDVIVDASGTYGNNNYSGLVRIVSFPKLKMFVQDLGVCRLRVRENWGGMETSCTPSLTSSILTQWPDTRGHRAKIPGEETKLMYLSSERFLQTHPGDRMRGQCRHLPVSPAQGGCGQGRRGVDLGH